MALFRISIRLRSPLVTPLKGDTIWGHVVWGIANHEGEDAVAAFLKEEASENPPFVISSAFPAGFICKPLPKPKKRGPDLTKEKYADIKKQKKIKYTLASEYISGVVAVSANDGKSAFEETSRMHNSINRFSSTVSEGGALYAVTELWAREQGDAPQNGALFDLYAASSYSAERVTELCAWAFENGYGADSSTGKGWINVENEAHEVMPLKAASSYMALAPFSLDGQESVKNLRADIFVRSGKVSNVMSDVPWKKTLVLYDEGAVFESEKPLSHIGTLISNVHADDRVCHAGFAPVVPIDLEEAHGNR